MGIEAEHVISDVQTAASASPSSKASTAGSKISLFVKKSGFIIPKNKLSGSLVPVVRGAKKMDADFVSEEAINLVHRKTRWGPDLTLDSAVRKGRALAYQTRINQISEQLTLGTSALEENEESLSTSESQYGRKSDQQLGDEESELLAFERREIIGEILKLNSTYKAPADYKPLIKEAKVPIPIKEHPGCNFIGSIFGPANDTQKRLEKETGAKIRVFGIKSETGGKVEITPSDGKETGDAYEELYVLVSADSYEKIDAAVALTELLVTPHSANTVSSFTKVTAASDDNMNTHLNRSTSSSTIVPPTINQGLAQPNTGFFQPPQGQFPRYPHPWFRAGPPQTPTYSQSGLVTNSNSSASLTVSPNPSVVPSTLQLPHALQPPYMQQASQLGLIGGPRNSPQQLLQAATSQVSPRMPPHNLRPFISTLPQSAPQAAVYSPASQGLTKLLPMTPPAVPSHGPNAVASQSMVATGPSIVNNPSNLFSPFSGPLQSAGPAANVQSQGGFSPMLPLAASGSAHPASQPAQLMAHGVMRAPPPPPNGIPGPMSIPFQATARPLQPSSSDFTFQPNRPPIAAAHIWQSRQPSHPNIRPPVQAAQAPLPPQPPLLRPMSHNMNHSPVQVFPRPQMGHQTNQPRPLVPTNFAGVHSRHTAFPGHNMQPRNFIPPNPLNSPTGPFPHRPTSQMHFQENYRAGAAPPPRFSTPHQNNPNHHARPFSNLPGPQQVYDPFSPTSTAFNQMGGKAARVQGESDPEYDDLMASVGVE